MSLRRVGDKMSMLIAPKELIHSKIEDHPRVQTRLPENWGQARVEERLTPRLGSGRGEAWFSLGWGCQEVEGEEVSGRGCGTECLSN